ncbi:MAG: NAD(P)-binding domain-containing protein [Ramlibacter sp.]|nr:NAD(P)-binding domain-containing protein [Ramlibacter sp.]
MQIGMIGLGRMGANMVTRLFRGHHDCVVHDRSPEGIAHLVAMGATGAASLRQLVDALKTPPAVWLMVPAAAVDALLEQLTPLLKPGDIPCWSSTHPSTPMRRARGVRPPRTISLPPMAAGAIPNPLERKTSS